MKTNNNKILGNYLNKQVYRINSKFNEGEYYINFNNVNYTLPKWKADQKPSIREAIECIHDKMELDDNINDNDLIHLKNGLNKKVINIIFFNINIFLFKPFFKCIESLSFMLSSNSIL